MKHTFFLLALAGLTEFAFAQTPHFWDRESDWVVQPDSSTGTSLGNPSTDSLGQACYEYSYVTSGGGLGSANPWYDEPRTLKVWDNSWYGGEGGWAGSDNIGAVSLRGWFTHPGQWVSDVPIVTWHNPQPNTVELLMTGSISVVWTGDFGIAEPVNVDLVIGMRNSPSSPSVLLTSMSLAKPTPDTSSEHVSLEVSLPGILAGPDAEVFWSIRAPGSTQGHWVTLADRHLNLIPSAPGSEYCQQTTPNSRGLFAEMLVGGSADVLDNDITLKATGMPFSQFGMFVCSQQQGFLPNPGGSQGNLCLGGQIGRFNSQLFFTDYGEAELDIDLGALPTPPGTSPVLPGDTWYFQAWHREVGSTSHFTSAVAVPFQ